MIARIAPSCDLAAEARRDVLHPERLGVDGAGEARLEGLRLAGRQRLGADWKLRYESPVDPEAAPRPWI